MNIQFRHLKTLMVAVTATFILAACATAPSAPEGAAEARDRLTQLQANAELATLAPVEIQDAERAVSAAEQSQSGTELAEHLVLMADHKVEIARAWAQSRLYVEEREELNRQAEIARLNARTLEAELARSEADAAQTEAEIARSQAAAARAEALAARDEASDARQEASQLQQEAAELQRQIAELNARPTDRGLVVNLGDVLFATNGYELQSGDTSDLDNLVAFLNQYEERTVIIEGHTDSVGDAAYNQTLSENRANAVRNYLVNQGISATRITTLGLGEGTPVADNSTATGRQQNRRVEVIISNAQE